MHNNSIIIRTAVILVAGLFLAGCNPTAQGMGVSKGGKISTTRLIAAKRNCGYSKARQRALRLLDAAGNVRKNQLRAAKVMERAEQCMRKYGVNYRYGRAYGIGDLKLRLK
jgi:predicted small secreted protein